MWCSDVRQFHPLSRQLLGTIEDAGEFRVTPATTKLVQDWDSVYDVYASRDWLRALDALEAFADQHPDDVLAGIISIALSGFCSSRRRELGWNHPLQQKIAQALATSGRKFSTLTTLANLVIRLHS